MIRPDSAQWTDAKTCGDAAERAIAGWFAARGYRVFQALGRADFDLLLQLSVEVKHDRRAAETGNVAIEVSYRDKPSGLITSAAHYWVIVVGAMAFIIETARLRDFVLRGKFSEVAAGDAGRNRVKLVPVDRLKNMGSVRIVQLEGPA